MRKIRVLIVDDSTVIRRLLSDTLAGDAAVEVAATAPNGRIALAKLPQVNPDLVTLDMEMPELDGIGTLVELRKLYPRLPVIMFSTLSQRGAHATFEALSKGANDYVAKPANIGSVTAAIAAVRNELIPKIKALCPWHKDAGAVLSASGARLPTVARPARRTIGEPQTEVVVVGVSTGGPNALASLLSRIPAGFPAPIVVVQHMPPVFTKHLAERLNQLSPLDVTEAQAGDALRPGGVWIAPGDRHLVIERRGGRLVLDTPMGPPENSCRPAVDVLFRSAAQVHGANVLAVVMTGMGQDGLRGSQVVRDAGGWVFAQDEASSVVWGMPGAVTEAGVADSVWSLEQLPQAIQRHASRGRNARALVASH